MHVNVITAVKYDGRAQRQRGGGWRGEGAVIAGRRGLRLGKKLDEFKGYCIMQIKPRNFPAAHSKKKMGKRGKNKGEPLSSVIPLKTG